MAELCTTCGRQLPASVSISVDGADATTQTRTKCPVCDAVDPERTASYRQPETDEEMRVAHFQLVRRLGGGGFGEVWLANDVKLGRPVALKLPKSSEGDAKTLLFEARTAAGLRHPHIVSVFEVGDDRGQVYIASELIDGLTLKDFLTQGRPRVPKVVELLLPIARALHFAHQRGVIHRDIKPANILLDHAGQPFLADFGIAKKISADASLPIDGQVVGTARYMSPEQAGGRTRETDARSDIYALGVTMFEMLTGETPFRGNISAILHQKVSEDAPSPRKFDSGIPKDLETICLKCLEREPEKRFSSAQELVDELVRFSVGDPIRSRPISRPERVWRWCRRRPAISGLLASTFLSLTLGLLGVSIFWRAAAISGAAARESLYRSWMNLTANHLDNGDTVGVRDMLRRIEADPELARLRGFEWNYFDTLIRPLHPVANAGDAVQGVAISRDGTLCAAIGRGLEVRVWDAQTDELIRTLTTEVESYQSIDFSPTSAQLATGGNDGFVRLWEPLAGARMLREMQHGPRVSLVRFSPDGRRLISVGKKGAARLWDVATGEKLSEIPTGQQGAPRDARFTADGRTLYVATDTGQVRTWDVEAIVQQGPTVVPTPLRRPFTVSPEVQCFAVSSDGKRLLSGDFHGVLTTYSLEDDTSTRHQTFWGRIDAVEFLPGTHLAAIAANDGQVHLFDVDRRQDIRALNTHGLTTGNLALAADGRTLVVGSGDGSVSTLKLEDLSVPNVLWHGKQPGPEDVGKNGPPPVRALQMLPDGRRVIAAYDSAELRVWDLKTGTWTPLSDDPARTGRLVTLQPGGNVFATTWNKPVVTLWNAQTFTVERELPTAPTGAIAIRFSPRGRWFACAGRAGPLHVYDTGDWSKPRHEIPAQEGEVVSIAFSPDEKTLAVARLVGGTDLLDVASGKVRRNIPLDEPPSVLTYTLDGTLAVGTVAGEILLWDAKTDRLRDTIKGHTGRIHALTTLPGSDMLVSGGRDRLLKMWDVPSGELVTPLAGHFRQVFALAAATDGETIVSGGLEGEVRIWKGKTSK